MKLENIAVGWVGVVATTMAGLGADAPIEVALRRATALEVRGWGPRLGMGGAGGAYALGQVVDTPVFTWVRARPDGLTADGLLSQGGGVASMPGSSLVTLEITTSEGAEFVSVGSMNAAAAQSLEDTLSTVGIACGEFHTLLLKRDGTVAGRGWNGLGQATVPAGLTNVVSVGCGLDHSLAVLADGRAVLWGRNDFRQAEVEESENHGFVAGAGGLLHTILLRKDGTIHVTHPQFRPGSGAEPIVDAVAVAAGATHSVVLHADGRVSAFGRGAAGVLTVPTEARGAVAVAAGGYFSMALKPDGRVVAWGDDSFGQTRVPGVATNVVAIAAGSYHGVALRRDGRVVAWGEGSNGALDVPSNLTGVLAVSAGGYHTQVLVREGASLGVPHREASGLTSDLFLAAGARYSVEYSGDLFRWSAGPVLRAQPGQFSVPFQAIADGEFLRVREWVGARGESER